MNPRILVVLGLLLLLLAPCPLRAEEGVLNAAPSPVGLWRLDREALELDLQGDPRGMLKSLLIPDIEFRMFPGGRYETWMKLSGFLVDGRVSGGTWTQSEHVVSLAGIRDDGQPGSVIARLKGDTLVFDLDHVEVPLTRVSKDPGVPQAAVRRAAHARDPADASEPWPPRVITKGNRRRVAQRIGAEVAAAVAKERGVPADELWKGVPPEQVVWVQGSFDVVGTILAAWRVPHTAVTPRAFLERADEHLAKARVLLMPCQESLPRALQTGLALAVRDFVDQGGYLGTTDWSVQNVLVPAFPKLVTTQGRQAPLPEILCATWVPPVAAASEPALVRGLPSGTSVDLWCEQAAFPFDFPEGSSHVTLMASNTLHLQFQRGRVIAFTARHGKGKLLHALPHLDQEEGTPAGARTMQRLFFNFVLEGLDARADDS